MSEKGPPLSTKPMRLAGTWQQYSKKAIPHENAITPIIGHLADTPEVCNFKCPYQASVIKTLLNMSSIIVYNPFISYSVIITMLTFLTACPCLQLRGDRRPLRVLPLLLRGLCRLRRISPGASFASPRSLLSCSCVRARGPLST